MISFGLVGCGRIGERHAEHICKQGNLIAVCDIDEKKARDFGLRFGVPFYTDQASLLSEEKQIDVISVCTPNGLHAEHTIRALEAGFHVLCEKPMALTVKDCENMIALADKCNRKLFVVKQNRFNPPVIAVKKLLDEGLLGQIYSVQVNCFWNRGETYYRDSWKGTADLDGGTLYTQFSHFIDLLYWMVGDVKEVYAITGNFSHQGIIEFEDTGCITIRFENGAIGTMNYTVNTYSRNMEGSITLIAERGTVKIGGQYLNEMEYQDLEVDKIEHLPRGNPPNQYGLYQGSMSNHDKVYSEVIHALIHGGDTTNGKDGLKTVEIINKIYAAAAKGK